ncbi:signal recognition particle-docking protein FtsY [Aquicoccus sp. SCR17]|nr:signal recognition particle-docking protein FtsY [Carideicomes alvinocaridis]
MAFFKKLKDRLFKSSSKLDEGLEAIVSDGGEEEEVTAAEEAPRQAEVAAAAPETPDTPGPDTPGPDTPPEPGPDTTPDPFPAPKPDSVPEPEPTQVPDPGPDNVPEPEPEQVPDPGPSPEHPPEPPGPDIPPQPGTPGPDNPARPETPDETPPSPNEVPPSTPGEMPGGPSELPPSGPQEIPDNPGTPGFGRGATMEAEVEQAAAAGAEAAPARGGLMGRLFGRGQKKVVVRRVLDDDMLESLEDLLISADMGVDTALRVTSNLAEGRYGKKLSVDEIKRALADEIARVMEPVAQPLPIYAKRPQVVLVVGVNGSGKTTTIGKLASQFRAAGKSVVIAAGDTFRAAAVEQLQVWGDRAGVPVLTAPEGSDPASLAFDAMTKAQADGADLLLIDTAGRLQNRADLMEELAKIVRVIRKKDPDAPHNTLLVLDATTGQNALSQVETFQKLADVSGLVMTKLDGTAKGGVLVALADRFGLPIHAIGVGEQIDDLSPFDPQDFAEALTGAGPELRAGAAA